MPPSFVRQR